MDLSKAGTTSKSQTGLHLKVKSIIQAAGFVYEEEYHVFRTTYSLDFYLPEFHVGIEADGPYHKREYDKIRDKVIEERSGIVIRRISESDLRDHDMATMVQGLVEFCEEQFSTMADRIMVGSTNNDGN
jgi:hypothetical protein